MIEELHKKEKEQTVTSHLYIKKFSGLFGEQMHTFLNCP